MKTRNLVKSLTIALALTCAISTGAEEKKREKPVEQPPPEAAEATPSSLAAVDAALRSSFKEYVGLSLDAKGAVLLTLSKGADPDAVANLARETWKSEYLPHFDFVEAVATPEELHGAFAKMRDVLALKDVVFLDLDEACGCISVGIARDSAAEQVAYFTGKQGISKNWIKTVVTPPIVTMAALTSQFRPTMGGIQIQFRLNATQGASCSLGLPTYSWRQGTYGFLTASHCTEGPRGEMRGTEMFQSIVRTVEKIGEETLDAPLFTSGGTTGNPECPAGRNCRYSDAAFAEFTSQTLGITGRIKRPTVACVGTVPCSLGVTRHTDDIRMVGGISGLFTGTNIDKIGRTTGWTRGPLTHTCVAVNVNDRDAMGNPVDSGMTLLCQNIAAAASGPGDSGGSVFEFHPTILGGSFAGILWGGPIDGTSMVFSPIDSIEKDLGVFVYNQAGVSAAFFSSGKFYTSNVDDELDVTVERNVVPSGEVEFVLVPGNNVTARKQLVLNEGAAAGNSSWTLAVDWFTRRAANGLYVHQLPGGILEFRKEIGNSVFEVSRVPLDSIPGGTRLTFTWLSD